MAALPSYVTLLFPGYGEEFDPSVEVVEMERGPVKMRVVNSHASEEISASLLFKSAADAASFDAWYFGDVGRIGYFDMTHPRLGGTVQARFKGGSIGRLVPLIPDFSMCQRDVVFEYLR